ncbi:hypothetical protein [Streptomyces atratus]|uniref:hypothetical protein n=1 Tax=Streptomyces atratus TaxID=1893 RepID=UPI003F53F133
MDRSRSGAEDTDVSITPPNVQLVAYPTAPGCAAASCPETDDLVPLDSTAEISNRPTSKGIVVGLERTTTGAACATATAPRSDGS